MPRPKPGQTKHAIRPAAPSDVPRLAELFGMWIRSAEEMAVGQQLNVDADWSRYFTGMLRAEGVRVLVAELDGKVAGFVVGRVNQTGRSDLVHTVGKLVRRAMRQQAPDIVKSRRVGLVEDIYVDPSIRTVAVAYDLVDELLVWFKLQGLAAAEGHMWARNETQLRLAKYMGFEPIRIMVRKELD
jgi:GNAT superfamily N-acetyltransferase